jgi:2-methylisocitrate lyase-like PEP mutase family enzyme
MPTPPSRVLEFRRLHEAGCFLMPNPWDVGTARFLSTMGFQALATTSAGFAFSRGFPDSPIAVDVTDVLRHVEEIAAATTLPVNADFQSGYAAGADGVFANVVSCVRAGVSGLSIEDASGPGALFDRAVAIDRMKAARAAIDETGVPVMLTGRCEAFIVGTDEPLRQSLDRLVAYAEAGADCLFAPSVRDPDDIAQIVAAVAPKPVNVVVSAVIPGLSVPRLAELGVRRVSLGAGLSKVAWGAFMKAAREIAATGEFDALQDAASVAELNQIFAKR